MKKTGLLVLLASILFMGSYAFAGTQTSLDQSEKIEVELLMEMGEGTEIEEVTILSTGQLLVVTSIDGGVMIQTVENLGQTQLNQEAVQLIDWHAGPSFLVSQMFDEFMVSYGSRAYRFDSDLVTKTWVHGMNYGGRPLDAQDTSIVYVSDKHVSLNHLVLVESRQDPDVMNWDGKEYWVEKRELANETWADGTQIKAIAFGDNENELYFLLQNPAGAWTIDKLQFNYTDRLPNLELLGWSGEQDLALPNSSATLVPDLFTYDEGIFQIASSQGSLDGGDYESIIGLYDTEGNFIDAIRIPGQAFDMDVCGNQTAVSSRGIDDKARLYLVYWEGKPSVEEAISETSKGPRHLIQEKTRKGETTASFRDGSYGLLKKEDEGTGQVTYLAPIRSSASKVNLEIPCDDILSRFGDECNLEILYGEDVIRISMEDLDARELLEQMPCETHATIEIHLIRGDDGTVSVTAELFVVEEVDDMTKCVHRMDLILH